MQPRSEPIFICIKINAMKIEIQNSDDRAFCTIYKTSKLLG